MSLKLKAVAGAKWTTLSMMVVTIAQLSQLAILARLLSPKVFGSMAIMMVVIGFSQAFMDMGISNAIIHRQKISHSQLSSLYWLNIASGGILAGLMLLLSPFIASFYDEPSLQKPLMLLSSVFLVIAIGNQFKILCQKEMQFDRIAKVDMTAAISALAVAVWAAMQGYGVYALVLAMLMQAGASSFLYLMVGLKTLHTPSFMFKHSELSAFYRFGFYQMGERSINYVSAHIDKLIIGKLLGMQAVGFYNMAWQLIIFPLAKINPVIVSVAFPVYAKVQSDSNSLNRYYGLTVRVLSLVSVPLLAFLSFFSQDVVLLVFGDGWQVAADLIAILALVGILKALGNPGGAILLAQGYANIGFWWNIFWAIAVIVGVYAALVIRPDVMTVPWVLLGLSLTIGWIWHYLIAKVAKISYRAILGHFAKIIIFSFIITWLASLVVSLMTICHVFFRLLAAGGICLALYIPYLFYFEKEVIHQCRKGQK